MTVGRCCAATFAADAICAWRGVGGNCRAPAAALAWDTEQGHSTAQQLPAYRVWS